MTKQALYSLFLFSEKMGQRRNIVGQSGKYL